MNKYFDTYYLTDDGVVKPVLSESEYVQAWQQNKTVAKTRVGTIFISTVFLTLDHARFYGHGKILFETMIFCDNEKMDNYQERYRTFKEAVSGHLNIVDKILKQDWEYFA